MFAQVSPVRKAPHEASCTRGAGPPLLLTLHPPGTRPSFVKRTVANMESCRFPDWQKVFLFIFSPSFHCFILKKKVQEIFSTVGGLCPGSCKTLPSPASFCVILTYPGTQEILLGEVVHWVTHVQVSCKGSRERKRTGKLPSAHPGPGWLIHWPAVRRAGNQARSPSSSLGSLCLRKTREERAGHPQCGRTVAFFFCFCQVFVFK